MENTMKMSMENINHTEVQRSETLISGSLASVLKVRLPFLIIALIGGLLAAVVIDSFEEILEEIVFVAIFIPVIMDMGGNIGAQASTAFARGLALGHIEIKSFGKHLLHELFQGLSMGVLLGIAAGLLAHVWHGEAGLGLAVGLALTITMTLASFLGFFVPYVLYKFKLDQVAGSSPIITTIKDISGLLIYFFLVSQFVGL